MEIGPLYITKLPNFIAKAIKRKINTANQDSHAPKNILISWLCPRTQISCINKKYLPVSTAAFFNIYNVLHHVSISLFSLTKLLILFRAPTRERILHAKSQLLVCVWVSIVLMLLETLLFFFFYSLDRINAVFFIEHAHTAGQVRYSSARFHIRVRVCGETRRSVL